ncbi:FAD-binding oxidoreductase [Oscillatoria sp. FACHB-1407]|uniref:NAD(P)/FAD-dependent oxidoreductase n=1 Tax=Oscillatoria sp. FACHB-1407 TaxID=2692847 RepID=UPI0016835BD8|nr:FAD-binding oxidoreductase [Oscillatoria sp. FACHB-1407]MBD2462475.1 FAD-binding oxidoreductase [Oscillatoria sp. FACHB-1407]
MKTADWIVVGGGFAGAALGYELARAGFSVVLLEQQAVPQNATRYSYGGIAYWSATTDLTRLICQEAMELYRNLSAELEADIQFRELDLVLTIDSDADPAALAAAYAGCAIPPVLISAEAACELEPLLDPGAIAAALHGRHGHVEPELITKAYVQGMLRLGGAIDTAEVTGFIKTGDRVTGVVTSEGSYAAANVVVSAGGLSRSLLQAVNIPVRCCFTQAELVETPPLEIQLRTIVMAAELKRFQLEAIAGQPDIDSLWDTPGHEIAPPILDAGAIQFCDGRVRMGQISRVLTDPYAIADAAQSELEIRTQVGRILPKLQHVPGAWGHCLVAFTGDHLPLIGALPSVEGVHIFSGFSSPFAVLPPLARRYARFLAGQADDIMAQFSPTRFA